MTKTICHISTVHSQFDTRIYYKECLTLKEAGYTTFLVGRFDKSGKVNCIHLCALPKVNNRFIRMSALSLIALARSLKTRSSIYHFHDPELLPITVFLKLLGKKSIYDVHENVAGQIMAKNWIRSKIIRMVLARFISIIEKIFIVFTTKIVAVTPDIAKKYSPDKTVVVRNYAQLSFVDQCDRVDRNTNKDVIIYAGALRKTRSIKEIIEAMQYINHDCVLWLLGKWQNDEYRSECEKTDGWELVKYLGFKELDRVYSHIKAADIGLAFAYPTKNSLTSLPNKIFEYMACSVPVITSDFHLRKKTFGECALFADPENPVDIAEKISTYLDDRKLMDSFGKNGRILIEDKYSWEAESKKLLNLYRRLSEE